MSYNYFGQLIIGPSGSGKTTYCKVVQHFAEVLKRNIMIVNLDPAAETLPYKCSVDIRELICLEDAIEAYKLGPNGGLVYCMEYLLENVEWLMDELGDLAEEDYLLFDCPGQLELYSHLPVMRKLTEALINKGFSLCSVCLVDSTFTEDEAKMTSGVLMTLSFMISLGLPHLSVLSKCDLLKDEAKVEQVSRLGREIGFDLFFADSKIEEASKSNDKYYSLQKSFQTIVV